ncbi:MAG TPA: hypothetical protein VHM28_01550, partial [Anaerolineales bacterium]|nr:hypothetical protein [Anaerolineales bacterium]
ISRLWVRIPPGAPFFMQSPEQIQLIKLLLARLERVSVDSYWAHRASGVRGALLKALERIEAGQTIDGVTLKRLTDKGFQILERAAKEISK